MSPLRRDLERHRKLIADVWHRAFKTEPTDADMSAVVSASSVADVHIQDASVGTWVRALVQGETIILRQDRITPGDEGAGLIIDPTSSAKIPLRRTTPDEDKSAKVLLFGGVDAIGRSYMHNLLKSMQGIIGDEAVMHHYAGGLVSRGALIHESLWRRDSVIGSGDLAEALAEVRSVTEKYLLSRLVDGDGQLKTDPLADGNMDILIVTHSFGGAFSLVMESMFREALLEHPEHYPTLEKLGFSHNKLPYDREVVGRMFDQIRILSEGLGLSIYDKDSPNLPRFAQWAILSADDMIPYQTLATTGLYETLGDSTGTSHALHDPNHPNRVITFLPFGIIPEQAYGLANVGAHAPHCYTHVLLEQFDDIVRQFVSQSPALWDGDLATSLGSTQYEKSALEDSARDANRQGTRDAWVTQLMEEMKVWREVTDGRINHGLIELARRVKESSEGRQGGI